MEKLGKKAKDKVSGMTGIVTGVCVYLFGSSQYLLQPLSVDGRTAEPVWMESERLEFLE